MAANNGSFFCFFSSEADRQKASCGVTHYWAAAIRPTS